MTFYQALQLDPAGLKTKIRTGRDRQDRWFYRLALAVRAVLLVAFAILLISVLSALFGSENTPMAVVLFCILLSIRFVNFSYCAGDSMVTLALSFGLLLAGPALSELAPPLLAAPLHFAALFLILLMTAQRPELGNGGLYSFAYVYLTGNPVWGEAFLRRALLTLTGYLICAAILLLRHRGANREVRFHHMVRRFDLTEPAALWLLRQAAGVSLVLALGRFFGVERFMWMGFACSSLLSSYPYSHNVSERFWQRILGALAGSGLFFVIYQLLPPALQPALGPVGGLCLGFCADYRYKTALNCFGALLTAAGIYGIHGAVALRIWDTLLGLLFGLAFTLLFHGLLGRRAAADAV